MNMVHNASQETSAAAVPAPITPRGPRGVARAIWSLVTPDDFEAAQPTLRALLYRGATRRGIRPLADVYLPPEPAPAGGRPSVVLVHGGGFVIGSRRMKPMRFLATRLVRSGYAVCAIDYRLVFRGGRLDEAVDDVASALAWWTGGGHPVPLARDRTAALGLSAGATLVLLAATDPRARDIHRIVSCFGLYDFAHLGSGLARLLSRLVLGTSDRAVWARRSVMATPQPAIPTLLLHGEADTLVPVEQAGRLRALRSDQDLPTELQVYPAAPHGFFNRTTPTSEAAVRDTLAFLAGAEGAP